MQQLLAPFCWFWTQRRGDFFFFTANKKKKEAVQVKESKISVVTKQREGVTHSTGDKDEENSVNAVGKRG